jgi:DNA-binding NtrC family response regulator
MRFGSGAAGDSLVDGGSLQRRLAGGGTLAIEAKNILIVDDDESLMRFLRLFLEMEGVGDVRGATNGTEALAVTDEFKPDIAVVDYWMPPVHGNEIAQQLRAKVPGVIIVAFSGLLEEKPEWADALFMKSELFDIASLKEMLERTSPE